ncbi:uncharacterized protein LOC131439182 [Malaya genurostris]|uniref:uncharacterized protein LOC131439182 n=1 Tax=Malaya genurostris TaxID=325434 RepID=UPI0026F3A8FC|nr:uncharacterized protein LOC131439182 [Malaya genurostris]
MIQEQCPSPSKILDVSEPRELPRKKVPLTDALLSGGESSALLSVCPSDVRALEMRVQDLEDQMARLLSGSGDDKIHEYNEQQIRKYILNKEDSPSEMNQSFSKFCGSAKKREMSKQESLHTNMDRAATEARVREANLWRLWKLGRIQDLILNGEDPRRFELAEQAQANARCPLVQGGI